MKKEKLIEDVIKAIDKWKAECIKQGDTPHCISTFASINHGKKEISCDKQRIFGNENYVKMILESITQEINLKFGKRAPVTKKSGEELVMEEIMRTANGEDIMHVKQVPNSKKRLFTLNVIKTKKVK